MLAPLLPITFKPHFAATDECIEVCEQPVSAIALNHVINGGFSPGAMREPGGEIPISKVGPMGLMGMLIQGIRMKSKIYALSRDLLH